MTPRLALLCLLLAVACLGCKQAHPEAPEAFAVAFVNAARSGKLDADWVDDALATRLRRAQRLKLAAHSGAPATALEQIWNQDPDADIAAGDRTKLLRERAAAGLSRTLKGECSANSDDRGRGLRVASMTEAPAQAPEAVLKGLKSLADDLASARLLRVSCADGAVGLLATPHGSDGKDWRVVDIFALPGGRPPVPVPTTPLPQ
jgi:hypothetical protein